METNSLIVVIIFFIIIYFGKNIITFFTLTNTKLKLYNAKIVTPKDVEQNILIRLVEYERILYKNSFTRRSIVKLDKIFEDEKNREYRFYYYNLLEGVHAFIVYKNNKFYYYFETLFNSQYSVISSNYYLYIKNAIPTNIDFNIYANLSIRELYKKHLVDRVVEKESVFKKRLEGRYLIKYILFKRDEYLETLLSKGYLQYMHNGYSFKRTFILFIDSNELLKTLCNENITNKSFSINLFKLNPSFNSKFTSNCSSN